MLHGMARKKKGALFSLPCFDCSVGSRFICKKIQSSNGYWTERPLVWQDQNREESDGNEHEGTGGCKVRTVVMGAGL